MFGIGRQDLVEALREALAPLRQAVEATTRVPEGERLCPFFRAPCIKHRCEQYMQVLGKHPQTGADIAEWGCTLKWLPLMQIETSQQIRQAGAATESFRNEVAAAAHRHNLILAAHLRARQLGTESPVLEGAPGGGMLSEH